MAKAPIETPWTFPGYEDVEAGIVRWPMSCIRLTADDDEKTGGPGRQDPARLARLLGRELLCLCRDRRRAPQHHHPHRPDAGRQVPARPGAAQQHHHRRASPGRFPPPRQAPPHQEGEHRPDRGHGPGCAAQPPEGRNGRAGAGPCGPHPPPASTAKPSRSTPSGQAKCWPATPELDAGNVHAIVQEEIGHVFAQVLEDAGVYKRDEAGHAGFVRFLESVKLSPLRHSPLARPVPPLPHAGEANVTYKSQPPTFTGLRS